MELHNGGGAAVDGEQQAQAREGGLRPEGGESEGDGEDNDDAGVQIRGWQLDVPHEGGDSDCNREQQCV